MFMLELLLRIRRWLGEFNMERYAQEFIKHGFTFCGHLANLNVVVSATFYHIDVRS